MQCRDGLLFGGWSAPRTAAILGRARCEPRKPRERAHGTCAYKDDGSSVQGRSPGELQVPGGWGYMHVLWVRTPTLLLLAAARASPLPRAAPASLSFLGRGGGGEGKS